MLRNGTRTAFVVPWLVFAMAVVLVIAYFLGWIDGWVLVAALGIGLFGMVLMSYSARLEVRHEPAEMTAGEFEGTEVTVEEFDGADVPAGSIELAGEFEGTEVEEFEGAEVEEFEGADVPAGSIELAARPRIEAQLPPPTSPPDPGDGADPSEPPRHAYGLLEAPDEVVVGRQFELTVGLSAEQQPGVAGLPFDLPPLSAGPFVLTVDIDTDGFVLEGSESWRNSLNVTADDPYPTLKLHLIPASQRTDVRTTKIEATFSVEGQVIGLAVRILRVNGPGLAVAVGGAAAGVTMTVPPAESAPDITIKIRRWESSSGGRLRWSVETPHDVPIPETSESDIGDAPEKFALNLVRNMMIYEGKSGMYEVLLGTGRDIADKIPTEILTALRDVAAAKNSSGQVTCLILSAEPHVPWELAVLDPPLDPAQQPFLATQTVVGRWILRDKPPPHATPPTTLEVRDIAVVSGVYDQMPPWQRLYEAEEEASDLQRDFGAAPVDASTKPVLDCLRGTPRADVLHFAVHGKYDPGGTQSGLALVDKQMLISQQIRAAYPMKASPFVFLNACQAGSGQMVLGDYSGLAAAFLYAGASGVIAPLWSIDDRVARSIALAFYKDVLEHGASPAEVLAQTRRAIAPSGATSGTVLAYQFFGHPLMRFDGTKMT